eukprot:764305-Pyramimonas_sp.AAC.1
MLGDAAFSPVSSGRRRIRNKTRSGSDANASGAPSESFGPGGPRAASVAATTAFEDQDDGTTGQDLLA